MVNEYYQKTKKRLKKNHMKGTKILLKKKKKKYKTKARDRYKNLSEEEKEKKRQYHSDRTKNLSEEEKQEKVECMRNHYLAHKKIILGFYKVVGNLGSLGQILTYKNLFRVQKKV